jgi:LysM repeat protein
MPIRIEKDDDTEDNSSQDSRGTGSTAYTVRHGDTLGSIAKQFYGDGSKYNLIFEANRNVWEQHGLTPNANLIKVGWELVIPPADGDGSADAADDDETDANTTADDTTDTTNDDDTSDDDTTNDDNQTDDNDDNSDDDSKA